MGSVGWVPPRDCGIPRMQTVGPRDSLVTPNVQTGLIPLGTDSERQYVNDLYAKKYLSARLARLLKPKGFAKYGAFKLQSE